MVVLASFAPRSTQDWLVFWILGRIIIILSLLLTGCVRCKGTRWVNYPRGV